MFNLNKIIRPNILSLKAYSSARDEYKGSSGVFLDANENPFGTLNRYPDPYQQELKKKLSSHKSIDSNNIFIGNGSDEVIDLSFRIFCEPGIDKVLTFSPSYGMYEVSANINNVEIVKVPLNDDFQINLTETEQYFNDPNIKIIFICSPNNPTGNIIDEDSITYILKNFNGLVFIDEAYIDFSPTESWASKIEFYPNLIVSQTFSKAWGLAAARVGIAYANAKILAYYNNVKPPYNVSKLNQQAAINALENSEQYEQNKQLLLEQKKFLVSELSNIDSINKIYPSDANFILIEVDDADKIYQELIGKKVIVRNRNKLVKNCIRISIGTAEENSKFLTELKQVLKKLTL